jgi:hypothetical protein
MDDLFSICQVLKWGDRVCGGLGKNDSQTNASG